MVIGSGRCRDLYSACRVSDTEYVRRLGTRDGFTPWFGRLILVNESSRRI
jgi:hypothetical protein